MAAQIKAELKKKWTMEIKSNNFNLDYLEDDQGQSSQQVFKLKRNVISMKP